MHDRAVKMAAFAVMYVERFGLSVIPMLANKKPAIKWAKYQEKRASLADVLSWGPIENLAIVTGAISGLVVVDCESCEDAEWFWRTKGETSCVTQTRRGFHLYFRHPGQRVMNGQKLFGRYDVRGDGGYVLAPPSQHSAGEYRWVKPLASVAGLPVFRMEWRPESPASSGGGRSVTDGVAYIQNIRAVAGQGGHNDTYRAVQRLFDAGMSEGEALAAMQEWNQTNAEPKWSSRELLHKVRSVYAR